MNWAHRARMALALVVGFALVFASALVPAAFAKQRTVVNNTSGHTYAAYQVFSGTQDEDDPALGDIEWGSGVNGEALLAALKADARFVSGGSNMFDACNEAVEVARVLSDSLDDSDVAKAFANVADAHRTGVSTAIATDPVDLDPGYYLLVDTTTGLDEADAYNPALLQVTNKGDITITKKYTVPTVTKTVTDRGGDTGKVADYGISDTVPFTLEGTVSGNLSDYEAYAYSFVDTRSAGLTYNGDAAVTLVNGSGENQAANLTETDVTGLFRIACSDGTLTVACDDLLDVAGVSPTSVLRVNYTATLNGNAVIGGSGNPNVVKLQFSNNPNGDGAGVGTTPEDKVVVFTYELDTTKLDAETGSELPDARFVLYAAPYGVDPSRNSYAQVDLEGRVTGWTGDKAAATTLVSGADGLFKVIGLASGQYWLEEVKAPDGYNTLSSAVPLTVEGTLSSDSLSLTALTVAMGPDAEPTAGDVSTGTVAAQVLNRRGSTLPNTGGAGATFFYIAGAALAVCSAAFCAVRLLGRAGRAKA